MEHYPAYLYNTTRLTGLSGLARRKGPIWVLWLMAILSSTPGMAASVSITATERGDGGVLLTGRGFFQTCRTCDASGTNCTYNNSGYVATYHSTATYPLCSDGGNGSASCTAVLDRGTLHGSRTFRAYASDCKGNATETTTTNFDNTPTVSVTGPSGTVSEPFDITGTANFKPTLSATKGTIHAYVNGGYVGGKSCTSETCSFSYKEISGRLYDMNHGGPYTIRLVASGGGASASAEGAFSVDKSPTVSVTGPSGTVSEPFDITGTATFKPTLSATKGTIHAYVNGGYVGGKPCSSETCSFSYKEISGRLYDMNHGGPYTIRLVASGGGASASDEKTFLIDKTPTVNIITPRGCTNSPFNIIGTATFQPTLSATKGTIYAYVNGGYIGGISCSSENCTFDYLTLRGALYSLPAREAYVLKLTASGGGASASVQTLFSVHTILCESGFGPPSCLE